MSEYLIIIGAGGHGRVSYAIAKSMNKWEKIYFCDDNPSSELIHSDSFIGNTKVLHRYFDTHDLFVGIGSNEIREKVINNIIENKGNVINLIHSSVVRLGENIIGNGNIIMPNSIISNNVTIGDGCIINTNAIIEHDTCIGNFVHVSPNATLSGNVKVGNRSWIGAGATIINNINLCSDVTVGAGSVVIRNIEVSGVAVGNPAKIIKSR